MKRFLSANYRKLIYLFVLVSLSYIVFASPAYGLIAGTVIEKSNTSLIFPADREIVLNRAVIYEQVISARQTTEVALVRAQTEAEEQKRLEEEKQNRARLWKSARSRQSGSAGEGYRLAVATAYSCVLPSEGCNSQKRTASGEIAREGYVASNDLPIGTRIEIKDVGEFVVMDRGGGGSNWIDIFKEDLNAARQWGRRQVAYRVL